MRNARCGFRIKVVVFWLKQEVEPWTEYIKKVLRVVFGFWDGKNVVLNNSKDLNNQIIYCHLMKCKNSNKVSSLHYYFRHLFLQPRSFESLTLSDHENTCLIAPYIKTIERTACYSVINHDLTHISWKCQNLLIYAACVGAWYTTCWSMR